MECSTLAFNSSLKTYFVSIFMSFSFLGASVPLLLLLVHVPAFILRRTPDKLSSAGVYRAESQPSVRLTTLYTVNRKHAFTTNRQEMNLFLKSRLIYACFRMQWVPKHEFT